MRLSPDEIIALNRLTLVARLVAGIAHDLNNALQIIGGSAELLAALPEMNEPARRAADRIQSQATRAAGVVNDLMQFARDRGDTVTTLSLRDVVSRSIQMRGFAARRAGLVLVFDAAAAPAAMVHGNAAQLQQAVLNLIINAEQACHGAHGRAISAELEESSDDAVLRIVDNGRGIAPEIADQLFDLFVTTRPVPDATGLGLAATRLIAQKHAGDVTLEPRSPGSCATLRLPRGFGHGVPARGF
jgi:two-component system NtrC family sensor kinase